MAQYVNMYHVELANGTAAIENIRPTYQGNANANRIGAIVTENGKDKTLGGRCAGLCVRADGSGVPLTGTVTGNQAYVTLDGNCYEVPGQIIVFITWVASSSAPAPESVADTAEETTLLCVYGNVVATSSGSIIQPVEHLPDYAQLLSAIEDMEDATDAANAAAENAASNIASVETDDTADMAHVPGTSSQYFNYDGILYQATETIAKGGTITPGTNCLAVPSSTMSGLSARVSENHNAAECLYDVQDASSFINSSSTNASYNISGNTGKWVRNEGNTTSKIVPIPPGVKKITVTAHATNGSIYAFLQDGTPVANDYPVYADEYPARFDDGKMRTREFKVEADMGFLYILTNPSTANKPKTPTVTFDYMRTDPGLSAEHIPADAKAVGDRIGVFGKYVSELPKEYRQVEYVESTGSQIIDTEFIPKQNTRMIVDCLVTDKSGANTNYVFGSRTNQYDANGRRAMFMGVTTAGYYYFGFGNDEHGSDLALKYDFKRHKVEIGPDGNGRGQLKVDGETLYTASAEEFTGEYKALLFGINTMSHDSRTVLYGRTRIYGAQIWDGNNLAKDYVPCVRLSDDKPGMYDLVQNNFKAATVQSGGTQPIAGDTLSINNNYQYVIDTQENIEQYVVKVPKEYRQVEYIESTGHQIVDTGVTPDQDTRMAVDFVATERNGSSADCIFGSRTYIHDSAGQRALALAITTDGYYSVGWNTYLGADLMRENWHKYDFKRHTVEIGDNAIKEDGVLVYSGFASGNFKGEWTMLLFGRHATSLGSETIEYGKARIYGARIYQKAGTVITVLKDYVPCVRVVDGTPGMYDLVNGAFAEVELDTSQETPEPAIVGNVLSIASNYGRITAVEEEIGDLTEAVGDIQATLEPKTYIQTEADRVAAKVREVQTGNSLTFAAVSDLHYAYVNDPSSGGVTAAASQAALQDMRDGLKAIAEQTHIDFYACFGDVVYQLAASGVADYDNGVREMIGVTKLLNDAFGNNPQVRLVGNHDTNTSGPTGFFPAEQLNAYTGIYSSFIQRNEAVPYGAYGVYDFERQKIRLIVLNTSMYGADRNAAPVQNTTFYALGPTQAKWFAKTLHDVNDKPQAREWKVVVFSHVILDSDAMNCALCMYTDILDAYERGDGWKNGNYTVNFGGGYNAAELALWVCGHAHLYKMRNVKYQTYRTVIENNKEKKIAVFRRMLKLPAFMIPNALPGREDYESIGGGFYHKTADTAASTAFELMTLNREKQMLYGHHYGAGLDMICHYEPAVIIKNGYADLTSQLASPTWGSSDTGIASVSNGRVTGVEIGNTVIWAKEGTGNEAVIEVWPVTVSILVTDSATFTTELEDPVWGSSDTDVAIVENGAVTIVSTGNAVIWARSGEGNDASIDTWYVKAVKTDT